MQSRTYRADIDGLRGIAILAVLLFHYRLPGIPGGFIGVDIFFVISGYLITRNIRNDIAEGSWSYASFYSRRARRLFPALFVTLAACFVAATLLLPPGDLEWFAVTTVHSAVSTSNFLYWLKLGYFGPTAEHTPLLHTWSLSVEEQFYLVWPALMLLFLAKFGGDAADGASNPGRERMRSSWLIAFLLVTGALSVAVGQWMLATDPRMVFYLMPFRIAEFGAGALLVWLPRIPAGRRWLEEALLGVGLVLLAYCLISFRGGMPYPGIASLLPTLGAALVLYAGRARLLGLALRNPALVWVGLISYSLYLVHWPLLVFTELAVIRPLEGWETAALALVAMAVAWLMVRLVERPFRRGAHRSEALSPAAFGLSCAGLTVVLLWVSTTAIAGQGWPWRIPMEIRAPVTGLQIARDAREARVRTGTCHMNMWTSETADGNFVDGRCMQLDSERPNYLVFGDSYAADRYIGLSSLFTDVNLLQLTTASCRPLLDTEHGDYHCRERVDYALRAFIPAAKLDGVVLAGRWRDYDLEPLAATLAYLKALDQRVIVLGPAAEFQPWPIDLLFHHGKLEGLEELVGRYLVPDALDMDQRVRAVAVAAGVDYYSSIDAFCPNQRCPVLSANGRLLVVDHGHQSPEGALIQARGYRDLGLSFPRREFNPSFGADDAAPKPEG